MKNEHTIRFLEIIKELGVSDPDLCRKVDGLTSSYLAHYRSGKQGASLTMISNLCKAFKDVNANYILTGTGNKFLSEYKSDNEVALDSKHDELYNEIVIAASKYNPKSISDIVIMSREEFERSQELYRGLESLIEKIAIRATSKSEEKNLNIG